MLLSAQTDRELRKQLLTSDPLGAVSRLLPEGDLEYDFTKRLWWPTNCLLLEYGPSDRIR
jgi:hypothetical protein